ncbi:hypothetical protein OROMI_019394 [Orobanche minor]
MDKGSLIDPTDIPSLSGILHNSVIIPSDTTISRDGKVQSYCRLKLTEITKPGSGTWSLPGDTGIKYYKIRNENRTIPQTCN